MTQLDNKLTNDAKFLISSMYAKYIQRRKEQMPKSKARNFHNIDYLKTTIMPEWSTEYILDTCFELRKHGYLEGALADDTFYTLYTLYTLYITTEAIAELEQFFKAKTPLEIINLALDYAAKIKSVIPFL